MCVTKSRIYLTEHERQKFGEAKVRKKERKLEERYEQQRVVQQKRIEEWNEYIDEILKRIEIEKEQW